MANKAAGAGNPAVRLEQDAPNVPVLIGDVVLVGGVTDFGRQPAM